MEEWRELLDALALAYMSETGMGAGEYIVISGDDERLWAERDKALGKVLADRIVIAQDLKRLNVRTRWISANAKYNTDHDSDAFAAAFDAIKDVIIKAATAQ